MVVPPPTDDFDPERARRTIEAQRASEKAANDRAKAAEKAAADLTARLKAFEDAQLSEAEKLQRQAEDATKSAADARAEAERLGAQLRQERTRNAVVAEAARLHIIDPDAAYQLLDRDAIVLDAASGLPTNVPALLGQLVKDRPYLLPQAPVPGSPANPARSGPDGGLSEGDALYRQIRGGGPTIYDPEVVKAGGGGVFMPPK